MSDQHLWQGLDGDDAMVDVVFGGSAYPRSRQPIADAFERAAWVYRGYSLNAEELPADLAWLDVHKQAVTVLKDAGCPWHVIESSIHTVWSHSMTPTEMSKLDDVLEGEP